MEGKLKEVPLLKQESIMEAVSKAIEALPPEKNGKVEVKILRKNVDVTFTYRLGDNFSAGGFVQYNGKVDGGGRVTWEW